MRTKIKLLGRASLLAAQMLIAAAYLGSGQVVENGAVDLHVADAPWVGTYLGQSPAYNMKNREGRDVVMMGQTVRIPSTRWTLTLKAGGTAQLLQEADGEYASYSGTCTVEFTEEGFLVGCAFSVDPPHRDSNLKYSYTIDAQGQAAHCAPGAFGQPALTLLRQTSEPRTRGAVL